MPGEKKINLEIWQAGDQFKNYKNIICKLGQISLPHINKLPNYIYYT